MEPLRGGLLAGNSGQRQGQGVPASVQALWDTAARRCSSAEWALQWVWNDPQVSLALSGMSTMAQLEDNLASANRSAAGSLTAGELALVDQVRAEFKRLCPIPCTECKYCQPCPNNVEIPSIFSIYNNAIMFNAPAHGRFWYANGVKQEARADQCLQCGECESVCPQHIAIMEWLPKVDAFLTAKA